MDDNAPETGAPDGGAARARKTAPLIIDAAASPATATDAPETPAREPESGPAAPRRRGGWLGFLAAAIIGGIVVGLLQMAYQAATPDTATATARKAAADASAAGAAAKAAGDAVATLDARIAAIEARPAAPASDATAGNATAVKALDDKAMALEAALAALASRVGTLEARPVAAPVAEAPSAPAPPSAPAVDPAVLAGIEARLARLEAGAPAAAAVETRVGAVETEVGALAARVDSLAKEPAVAVDGARTVALALVRQAADTGRPFSAEIAALSGLGLDETALGALRPLAAKGAPSVAALQADFPGVADAVLDALDVPASDAGFLDRVASFGRGLVSIRPIEAIPGDTPVAALSRMQVAVDRGDLATALAERDALPAAGQAASAGWAASAEARIAVDRALAALAAAKAE